MEFGVPSAFCVAEDLLVVDAYIDCWVAGDFQDLFSYQNINSMGGCADEEVSFIGISVKAVFLEGHICSHL